MTRLAPLAVRLHGAAATFDAAGHVFAQLAIAAAQPAGFELLRLEVFPGSASAVFRADTHGAERWITRQHEVRELLCAFLEVAHRAATGSTQGGQYMSVTNRAEPDLVDRLLRRRPFRRWAETEGADEAVETERVLAVKCSVFAVDAIDREKAQALTVKALRSQGDASEAL